MKIAIITDTHYGCRKKSKLFHDYFEKFYETIFFPTLDEQGITKVIHMGDVFDSRKGVDFSALSWSKRVIFDPLKERNIDTHIMVGNHDTYYKNTNEINSVNLLLKEYDNITIYSNPEEVKIGNLNLLFIPWMTQDNQQKTLKLIKESKSSIVMGHLELKGFQVNKGLYMDHGMETNYFDKFEKVFSGHYHTRSDNGKIFYLGNPYEMFWNDLNDTRGFTIFDTETLEHSQVDNTYRLFYSIYYDDTEYKTFNTTEYEDKIVKVVVKKKTDNKKFEKFVDKLRDSNVAELKIVENFQLEVDENFEAFETEDTISILDRYIDESDLHDMDLNKGSLKKIMREIYQEACEIV